MTNPVGWECGKCGLVLAPHVDSHRCDPPVGGAAGRPVAAPGGGGGGGGTYVWPAGSGVSVTTGGNYSSTGTWTGSGGSGGYVSHPGDTVRVTAANAPLHLVPDSAA